MPAWMNLHAWPDRELYDVLVTSMGARRQPLTVITTTAGFDKHSLCYELVELCRPSSSRDRQG
jgi:phage terminase large subunit-like protein